jgi:putative Mn2+ efflux pump MntP
MDLFSTGYTATTFLANVATAGQDTFASLGPVLEVVGGIILAFIVIKYVLSLVKTTGKK